MKRWVRVFAIAVIGVILILLVCISFINDLIAVGVKNDLLSFPLPENTELVDSISLAGKLVGNGNGMQYFGAIFIESELSKEELNAFYRQYRENDWSCIVGKQTDNHITIIEHEEVFFDTDLGNNDYFIVYSWGSSNYFLRDFDLRGH